MARAFIRTAKWAHRLDVVGNHPAIDHVNTDRMVASEWTDTLIAGHASWSAGGLLDAARRLRGAAFVAIEAREVGRRPSLESLDAFLLPAASHGHLVAHPAANPEFPR